MNELFTFEKLTPEDLLLSYEQRGIQFLNIAQASEVLGRSDFETRYDIMLYRLDAFLIAGEYRIPIWAIRSYLSNSEKTAYNIFYTAIKNQELDGVYKLNFDGYVKQIVDSLKTKGKPITCIEDLIGKTKQFDYDTMDSQEIELQDWYDIPNNLVLPEREPLFVSDYAELFAVRNKDLAAELKVDGFGYISWPEVYDFLIEHELVNLPCPYTVSKPSAKTDGMTQLELF